MVSAVGPKPHQVGRIDTKGHPQWHCEQKVRRIDTKRPLRYRLTTPQEI